MKRNTLERGNAMTVKELIEELQKYDENLAVVRYADSKDSEIVFSIDNVEPYENDAILIW